MFIEFDRKDILVPICEPIIIDYNPFCSEHRNKNFLKQIKLGMYYLNYRGKPSLSSIEYRCFLKYAKNGDTMKEIGKELNISPRTVECHIRNVKSKLGVSYKGELKKIAREIFPI